MLKKREKQKGLTLITLLMVVFIIGVIALIAIPKLLDARERARARSTTAKMRYLSNAVQSLISAGVSISQLPDNIDDLVIYLKESGYETADAEDEWGVKFVWEREKLRFVSYGSDKAPTPCTTYTSHRCDIIVENGVFQMAPDVR